MDIEPNLSTNSRLSGWFKLETIKDDGTCEILADWFPNLIINNALNYIATNDTWLAFCQIGTGTATPDPTNTALGSRVASSNLIVSTTTSAQSSPPYYISTTRVFRFAKGAYVGNITEIGISAGSASALISRALILDGDGNPTSVALTSADYLQVTYQIRLYPATEDVTGTITLGGVDYTWTARPANITTVAPYNVGTSPSYTYWLGLPTYGQYNSSIGSSVAVYSGPIGDITSRPSGTPVTTISTRSATTYVSGSYESEFNCTWNTTTGNVAGGIGSIVFAFSWGCWQVGFTPNIPKTSSNTLNLKFKHSWARKTL